MNDKKKKTTNANDWLKMDLESQSGAIWINNESEKMQKKEKVYEIPELEPAILSPDPVKYGTIKINNNPQIID
ncbi:hypothetical protein EGH90_00325 [Kaistella haifensis]|nr:hypothetical protein EGH90_00325 [Kaistella haifensis]